MAANYKAAAAALSPAGSEFEQAMFEGLGSTPKAIPCKYFYDEHGAALFDQICTLPEYYVTRTELELLQRHADEIGALIGPDAELIEFGAGSGQKVRLLLEAMMRPHTYLPIDVSWSTLRATVAGLGADYPRLMVRPIVADFTRPCALPPPAAGTKRRVGFFPGSTIGNFTPEGAQRFLARMMRLLRGGALLIGVDLVKDPAILHAAYNDAAGITAAFNKNVLARANRELGADFDLAKFDHHACYNPMRQRIEMYLISNAGQDVRIAGHSVSFSEGEAIHTENSCKYTVESFCWLAAKAGFKRRTVWCDPAGLFSLHWLDVG